MRRSQSATTAIAFQRLNVALTFGDMSCAKIDPMVHQAKKPPWIKVRLPSNPVFFSTKALISDLRLHTVCESAQCPNRWECWSQGTATMMIAGDRCTRACGFCAVTTAKPYALEEDEPQRVAEAVRRMKLKHVVITAVARDDLKDGGANHFARTITAIREMDPSVIVEVLVPDFHAQDRCIRMVLAAGPDIYNHNMETVERLTPLVRSRAKYRTSLHVLRRAKELSSGSCRIVTKSGVMLGLGEKETELFQTMDDLREVGCEVLIMPPIFIRWFVDDRSGPGSVRANSFDGRSGHPGVSRRKARWRHCPPNPSATRSCVGGR
jgi:lipoic acid synthetase